MNISPLSREGHKRLSSTALKFLKYCEGQPECFKRSNFQDLKWEDPLDIVSFQSWPLFIGQETRYLFNEAAHNVFKLICSVPRRIFKYNAEKMCRYFNLSMGEMETALTGLEDSHIDTLVGRGDFVLSTSGLKCMEYNIVTNLGGWSLSLWEAMYLRNPLVAGFIKEQDLKITDKDLLANYLGHFIDSSLRFFPGDRVINLFFHVGRPRDRFVISMEQYLNSKYKKILNTKAPGGRLKGEVILDYRFNRLELKNQSLYHGYNKIHAIIEYLRDEDVPAEILELFRKKKVLLYNGPISTILDNKLQLALLSEHQESSLFNPEEKRIIRNHIPWTRKLIPEMENLIISNKDKYILKPGKGSGGKGVSIGRFIPETQWKQRVMEASHDRNPWVVQEWVESYPFIFQEGENGYAEFNLVLGLFCLGHRYSGGWGRVLPRYNAQAVLNIYQGAKAIVILEVDE